MEADELSVELTRKNEMLNQLSVQCTQFEVQVQELQDQKMVLDNRVADEHVQSHNI